MAVTQIDEIADGKGGQSSGPSDSSITRSFRVWTNNKFDTPGTIQPSMPINYGDFLAGFPGFQARKVSYSLEQTGPFLSVWTATYTFETRSIDKEKIERETNSNPLDRRAHITVRSVRYGKLTNVDKNGEIMLTSAGEPYPEIEKDASRWTIQVRKNYLNIPDWAWDYQDKINESAVIVKGRQLEAETVKFGEITIPELKIENGVEHFPLEFTLDYRRETWVLSRLDAGFYYLNDDDDYIRITDGNGDKVVIEELLDGSGGLLRDTVATIEPGDESYNEFDFYETADFSVLPLNET